jgi:RNA recognition motif-containing protein
LWAIGSMKLYFEIFGEVTDPIIMRDKDTRNRLNLSIFMFLDTSRGFGFVTFKHPRVLDEVLQMTPHIIDGKQVILVSIIHDLN